jgi:hypothetical protein
MITAFQYVLEHSFKTSPPNYAKVNNLLYF